MVEEGTSFAAGDQLILVYTHTTSSVRSSIDVSDDNDDYYRLCLVILTNRPVPVFVF